MEHTDIIGQCPVVFGFESHASADDGDRWVAEPFGQHRQPVWLRQAIRIGKSDHITAGMSHTLVAGRSWKQPVPGGIKLDPFVEF